MTVTDTARRFALVAMVAMIAALLPLSAASAQDETPDDGGADYIDLVINDEFDASDALQTSILTSQLTFEDGGADTVLLTTSEDGADALSAGVLADEASLLFYNDADGVEQAHVDEITRLGADTVVIIGGEARIPESVVDELEELDLTVIRLSGVDRISTGNEVLEYAQETRPDHFNDEAVHFSRAFGTETNQQTAFADAIGLGAWDAQGGAGTLLAPMDPELLVPEYPTVEYVTEVNPQNEIIVPIGGEAAVPQAVIDVMVNEYDQEARDRVFLESNNNRAGTAVAINNARGLDADNLAGVVLVDGFADDFFIDAYALSGLAANNDYAVLLTNGDELSPETESYLTGMDFAQSEPGTVDVICMPNVNSAACISGVETVGGDADDIETVQLVDESIVDVNTDFAITPSDRAILTVSTAVGTANENRAARSFSADVGDATAVSIALFPTSNISISESGLVTFRDRDGNALRADDIGDVDAHISQINGVSTGDTTDGGTNAYAAGITPNGGVVTFTVNSRTNNTDYTPVVFVDTDGNNQLNLDSAGSPTEMFGIGGRTVVIPPEAGFGQETDAEVQLVVRDATPPFFTTDDDTFFVQGNSDFEYDSGVDASVTITQDQFLTWLSGPSTNSNGIPGADGDLVDIAYNPGAASDYTISEDLPLPPTDVTATVGTTNSSSNNDVIITWVSPPNPDVAGFRIYQALVSGNAVGVYSEVGDVSSNTTTFNHEDQTVATYAYRVVAYNEESAVGDDNGTQSAEVRATIVAAGVSARPVSADIDFTSLVDPQANPPVLDNANVLDRGDSIEILFDNAPLTISAPSITVRDADGSETTLNSGNATFTLGPVVANNQQTLTVQLTANPVAITNGGNNTIDTNDTVAVISASGITNSAGLWNLPRSGFDTGSVGQGAPSTGDFQRVFANADARDNSDLADGVDQDAFTEDGGDSPNGTVNPATNTIRIAPGLVGDPDGGDIDNGSPFIVTNGQGETIASGSYNDVSGNEFTTSAPFAAGDALLFVFTDLAGINPRLVSSTTVIPNPSPTPVVVAAAVGAGGEDSLLVTWDRDITQIAPPSSYELFDLDNSERLAVGTATNPTAGNSNGSTVEVTLVEPNGDPFEGGNLATQYILRVSAGAVQDVDGNTPNNAIVFQPVITVAENNEPGEPEAVFARTLPGANQIEVQFDRVVTCPNTPTAWNFNNAAANPVAMGQPTSVTGSGSSCFLNYGGMGGVGNGDFGQIVYTQPPVEANRVSNPNGGAFADSFNEAVVDETPVELINAEEGPTVNQAILEFSEPVLCSSVKNGTDSFTINVDGAVSRNVLSTTCMGVADDNFIVNFSGAEPGVNAVVLVTLIEDDPDTDPLVEGVTDNSGLENIESSDSYVVTNAVAPSFVSATTTNASGVMTVQYSEPLDCTTVDAGGNDYTIDIDAGPGSPDTLTDADFDATCAGSTVTITRTDAGTFVTGDAGDVNHIGNVADLEGNVQAAQSVAYGPVA